MKTKNSNMVVAIFATVLVVILAGVLVAWMTGVFRDKKNDIDSGTGKITNALGSMSSFDFDYYDDATISGETLLELIEEVTARDEELSIAVQTLANQGSTSAIRYYNRALLPSTNEFDTGSQPSVLNQSSKSNSDYITPSAKFIGQVLRNQNEEVTGILFTQRK
jgi:lipopolysaccharide export LptBFGC system permease protein LptF